MEHLQEEEDWNKQVSIMEPMYCRPISFQVPSQSSTNTAKQKE